MLKFAILFSKKIFLKEIIEHFIFWNGNSQISFDYLNDNLLRFPRYYGIFFSICKICKIDPVGLPSQVGENMRNPNFLSHLIPYIVCNFDCTIALYWPSLSEYRIMYKGRPTPRSLPPRTLRVVVFIAKCWSFGNYVRPMGASLAFLGVKSERLFNSNGWRFACDEWKGVLQLTNEGIIGVHVRTWVQIQSKI
jgi:hypothetical protein